MTFTPAGRLNQLLQIERITGTSQSDSGEMTSVWTPVDEVFAEIKPLHGRNVEIALARTKGRSVSHQITMRWIPGIEPVTTRFNFNGRIFEIFQVIDVLELNREYDILANESVI